MLDLDRLAAECRVARKEDPNGTSAVREVVARAVSNPSGVLKTLGEPRRAGLHKLYHSSDLTILNIVWGPRMTLMPHDHRMWAVIGIYTGREDNIFWRRAKDGRGVEGRLEAMSAKALSERDCVVLGRDIIHSVTNPIPRLTGALHVYGGDFFAAERSEWDPETLREHPYDKEKVIRLFEESNALLP